MGAYLSKPVTTTEPTNGQGGSLAYGASAMQGWRTSQEDAHISLLDFDTLKGDKVALFAVFDGHGGAEVAQYSARHLPEFIKRIPTYQEVDLEETLRTSFLEFDRHLVEPTVLATLKAMAGTVEESESEDNSRLETQQLCEEACMPLHELLAKYQQPKSEEQAAEDRALSSVPANMKQELKPKSPFLRARTTKQHSIDVDDEIGVATSMCSSSSSQSLSSSQETNGQVGSSNGKHDGNVGSTTTPTDESSAGDISSSTGQKASTKGESAAGEDSGESRSPKAAENGITTSTPDNKVSSPTKAKKEDEENWLQSSQESQSNGKHATKMDQDVDSSERNTSVTTSQDETPTKPDKGKRKKVIDRAAEEEKRRAQRDYDEGPVYEKFLRDMDEEDEEDEEEDFSGAEDSDSDQENDSEDLDEEESEDEEDEDDEEERGAFPIFGGDMDEPGKDSGCTAVLALLHGKELYVANAGDSRCVVCRDGQAIEMSVDHKPEDDPERIRIEKAGGQVTADGRVNGGLNLSRALGDHAYKLNAALPLQDQMISPLPDIRKLTVGDTDEFMVLACDGIWNSLTSQQVVDFVRPRLASGKMSLSAICDDLFHECLAPNTMGDGTGCDNMTCIIVTFNNRYQPSKRKSTEDDEKELDVVNADEPSSKKAKVDSGEVTV